MDVSDSVEQYYFPPKYRIYEEAHCHWKNQVLSKSLSHTSSTENFEHGCQFYDNNYVMTRQVPIP
jgi:hypothetical protein